MSTLQERLALAMQGPPPVTAADLARACDISPPSVSEWVNGPTKTLRGPNAVNAAACLGVNERWLSTGKGPMRPGSGHVKDGTPLYSVAMSETRPGYVRFPLLDGFAGMGRGDYMGDYPEIVDFVEVTKDWASEKLRNVPPRAIRVITGRGQSMRGLYNDGDLVFVDSRIKEFDADAAYVFRWHGRVQIKRLQLIGRDIVRILSANPDFPPVDVPLGEVEIGGRALAAWTFREF